MTLQRELRDADSPLVHRVARIVCERDDTFTSVPDGLWDLVIRTHRGQVAVLQTGPVTRPVVVPFEPGDESIGIAFKPGVFMPRLLGTQMRDEAFFRPTENGRTFWIDRDELELPTFENAEGLVAELVRREIIVLDPVVAGAVAGEPQPVSDRSVQRHFQRVLGMRPHELRQILRAADALAALERGARPIDVAQQFGYADQAHLTRSLQRFIQRTPGQIQRSRQP
jgi:hypothetical protein